MTHLSDKLVSANKLIIGAAIVYAGAVSFGHAAEWRATIECPGYVETVAACQTRESCFAIGKDRYAKLPEAQRRVCETNISEEK